MEGTWKILENNEIILRKADPEDLDFLYSVENNPNLWFISDTKAPFSKWQIRQHIENSVYDIYTSKELRLIIESKESKKSLGIIDLFEFDPFNMRAGIGIVVCQEYQNMNIATGALGLVIDYAFSVLNLLQLWCNIDENNITSINLFSAKFGFERTGVLKKWKKDGGNFYDVFVFQLFNKKLL
ncbi:MAG: GNAT family N-acetyltransferase [Bacteroidales bacterium]|jgi:diamine N-acetyltransferase|nr:GNAT family N-acetyltransferase [Bacteroidales bacterium]